MRYLARTAGKDAADDLAQETFLRVYAALAGFRGDSSASTWIYRIVTNILIDHMRKKKTIVDRCNLTDRELFCKSDAVYITDEFRLVHEEMQECICSYIKRLPPSYRTAIVPREYKSMSVPEIDEVMGMSLANAKKTLVRARKRLKDIPASRSSGSAAGRRGAPPCSAVREPASAVRSRAWPPVSFADTAITGAVMRADGFPYLFCRTPARVMGPGRGWLRVAVASMGIIGHGGCRFLFSFDRSLRR